MSFYDDASLIMYPSGYKADKIYSLKPTDGSGDFDFTRSNDTATRVNSAGLIEKVRTNLLLQSNTFDTTWVNTNSTETGGQADKDGTTNAWLLQSTIASGEAYLRQTISASGSNTFSIYAKAGTANFLGIYINATSGADPLAYFNLSTGAVGTTNATASIVSVGSGWYRCSVAYDATIANVDVYVTTADGSFLSTSGDNIVIQSSQLESCDIATDYIPTTTAAVSVGMTANVPRIDYTGGGCGKLLLEPQRTNLVTFSEQMDNAAYTKFQLSITANNAVSPDGNTNADKLIADSTSEKHGFYSQITSASAGTYTQSAFFKAGEYNFACIRLSTDSDAKRFAVVLNLTTGLITATDESGSPTSTSYKVDNYGNGWYRLSVTSAHTSGDIFPTTAISSTAVPTFDNSLPLFTGNSVNGIFAYGCSLELGAYATSYIPTLSAASTRGADACSKTGISSLIGQTQGTLFIEIDFNELADTSPTSDYFIYVGNGSNTDSIYIDYTNGTFRFVCFNGATLCFFESISATNGIHKLALGYKSGDYVAYLDGVLLAAGNDTTLPPTCANISVSGNVTGFTQKRKNTKNIQIYKTRLSNAELETLTTL